MPKYCILPIVGCVLVGCTFTTHKVTTTQEPRSVVTEENKEQEKLIELLQEMIEKEQVK